MNNIVYNEDGYNRNTMQRVILSGRGNGLGYGYGYGSGYGYGDYTFNNDMRIIHTIFYTELRIYKKGRMTTIEFLNGEGDGYGKGIGRGLINIRSQSIIMISTRTQRAWCSELIPIEADIENAHL